MSAYYIHRRDGQADRDWLDSGHDIRKDEFPKRSNANRTMGIAECMNMNSIISAQQNFPGDAMTNWQSQYQYVDDEVSKAENSKYVRVP